MDYDTASGPPGAGSEATSYDLAVLDTLTGTRETFLNISTSPDDARSLKNVLAASSLLSLPAEDAVLDKAPAQHAPIAQDDADQNPFSNDKPGRYTQGQEKWDSHN